MRRYKKGKEETDKTEDKTEDKTDDKGKKSEDLEDENKNSKELTNFDE